MIRISSRKNKKGIQFAIETLVGLVLSVIALIIIISLFSKFFLQTPTNQKIVDFNAKSIVSFIEFSDAKYGSQDECYTMLRLENLENYQFTESGKNFFYAIAKKGNDLGVYTINTQYLQRVLNTRSLNGIPGKFYKIDIENLNLKIDQTKSSGSSGEIFFISYGGFSNQLKLDDAVFILLIPDFNPVFKEAQIDIINNNQNILNGVVYTRDIINALIPPGAVNDPDSYLIFHKIDEKIEPKGNYLIYEPKSKTIFLTNNEFSNSIVRYQSCFAKDIINNNYMKLISNNPLFADFINQELEFDYYHDNQFQNIIFKWSIKGIECTQVEQKTCADYFGDDYNDLTYIEFEEKLKNIYANIDVLKNLPGQGYHRIINMKDLNFEDIKNNIPKNQHYDFNSVFFKYEIQYDYIRPQVGLDEKLGPIILNMDLKKNYDTNFCRGSQCVYGAYKNGIIYFYQNDLNNWGFFNSRLLRKYNNDYYYMGEKISLRKIELKEEGIYNKYFSRDSYEMYYFDIETSKGKKRVFISNQQLSTVKIIN